MKAVMISIQPKWVEKIANGEKTIEVRKTRPKEETPFKCYIYQTIDGGAKGDIIISSGLQCGKVIGDFICDKVYSIKNQGSRFSVADEEESVTNEIARQSCLDYDDMVSYLGNKDGYAWHISDLRIYDKPKELSEFRKYCEMVERFEVESVEFFENCIYCPKLIETDSGLCAVDCENRLTSPPQSWQYVEEL